MICQSLRRGAITRVTISTIARNTLFSLLCLAFPALAFAAPTISTLTPASGAVGASVTVAGTGFGATQGTSTVKFNGTIATVTTWSATSLVVKVPTGATSGNVVVTVSGVASNGKAFTVVAVPNIASVSPTSGAVNASVTVAGSGFGATQGANTVKFNGITATVTTWSATSIAVKVPAGATSGNVVVHASGVDSNGKSFTVLPTPSIISLAPASGAVSASIVISGTNFGTTQGTSTVKFNGTAATVTAWGATSITARVPAGATSGTVVVTVSGVVSNGLAFTVVSAPAISTLSPTSGRAGTSITVTGSNFGATQGSSTVAFNGTLGTPTSWNATTVRVPVPSGATSGNVVVHASGVDSNGKAFTVLPSPTIATLSPASGLPGTVVTISGSNFGTTKGTSTVKFNGIGASTSSWGATSVVATVPSGATTGNVVITVGGVASNGVSFVVPVLTGLTVGPVDASLPIRSQQRYTATGTYSDGSSRALTSNVTWTATAPGTSIDSGGILTASSQGTAAVQASVGTTTASTTVQVTGPTFFRVGGLHTSRYAHSATRLPDGKVLIAGGQENTTNAVLSSAELYDPATGTFTPTGSMVTPRRDHTATLLPNGLVLIAGGFHYLPDVESPTFAELYDPATGTFGFAGSMVSAHYFHTATLLDNGSVLIAGGHYLTADGGGDSPTEIYNPTLGEFSLTGNLATPRMSHAATRLADGTVLVVGGSDSNGTPVAGAEVYDPVAGVFSPGGALAKPRQSSSATLEPDGRVLVVGRGDGCTAVCPSEVFDPVSRSFSATGSETIDRGYHAAALLPNGRVLVVGGQDAVATTGTAEVFDPASGTFLAAGALANPRWGHTATPLADGTVLIAGGYGVATAELFSLAPPVPSTLRVTPGAATMLVGQARSFAAVDQLGAPRPDAVWSVEPPTLATLDASSATLIATGAGTATITAVVQGVSASATVTISGAASFDPGATIWSLPPVSGTTATQVVPSSPSDSGPALYALHSSATETIVQAVADGVQVWQTWLPPTANNSVTDVSGGLVVTLDQSCNSQSPMRLAKLDAATGEPVWQFVGQLACPSDPPQIAVTPDNVLAVTTAGNVSGFPELMRINSDTGQVLSSPAIPPSSFKDFTGTVFAGYSRVGPPMVDAEGVVHLLYEVRVVDYPPRVTSAQIWMMDIAPSGASTTTMLTSTTEDQNLFPGRIIPDGAGGLVATWTVSPSHPPALQYPFFAAHVSAGGTSVYALPIAPAAIQRTPSGLPINPTLVLGRDGRAFVTDTTNPTEGPLVVSFNLDSGTANWSYRATPSGKVSLLAATSDGGLAINDTAAGIAMLDTAGAATPLTGPVGDDAGYSWTGEWHATGPQGLAGLNLPIDVDTANVWATAAGNASHNASAVALCPCQAQTTPADGLFSSAAFTPRGAELAALEPPTGSFVNLVGDPGFHGHSVGSLFDLAESTDKAASTAAGNTVVTQRVSSVPDFNLGLTTHGLITGGVNFFGHAGHGSVAGKVVYSMLFVGQAAGGDTNLSELNASMLSNAQLGPNVKVTIYACRAGLRPWDKPTAPSVAQVLADRLGRSVFAWKVGLFFSETPDRRRPSATNPRGPTIYLLPFAQDRSNVKACEFKPGQPEPLHCGGVR